MVCGELPLTDIDGLCYLRHRLQKLELAVV